MALTPRRHRVGGTSADVTQSMGEDNAAYFAPGETLWTYQVGSGGARVTDLEDENNNPVTQIVSTSAGQVPVFYTPVGVTELWAASSSGASPETNPRVLLVASDLMDDILTLDAAVEDVVAGSGIQSINLNLPDASGELAMSPADLVPAAALATDVAALAAFAFAIVVQVGAGYPARPSAAVHVAFVGSVDPGAAALEGDLWFYPSTES